MDATKQFPIAALFVSTVLAPWAPAGAVDGKVISGAFCIQEDASQSGFARDDLGRLVRSGSTSSRNLQCPMIRDNTTNTDGLDFVTMEVECPTNVTVSCTVTSRSAGSTGLDSDTDACSGDDVGTHTLSFDSVLSSSSPGYYHIACTISGSGDDGSIVSYEWEEP